MACLNIYTPITAQLAILSKLLNWNELDVAAVCLACTCLVLPLGNIRKLLVAKSGSLRPGCLRTAYMIHGQLFTVCIRRSSFTKITSHVEERHANVAQCLLVTVKMGGTLLDLNDIHRRIHGPQSAERTTKPIYSSAV